MGANAMKDYVGPLLISAGLLTAPVAVADQREETLKQVRDNLIAQQTGKCSSYMS